MENKSKFSNLLFDIACSAMACDYDIDEREEREIIYISNSTTYFEGIDISENIEKFKEKFNENPEETIADSIRKLKTIELDFVKELLVLEIVLRIIYADTKIDPHEIEFVKKIRGMMTVSDNIIKERFGKIDFLFNQEFIISEKDGIVKEKLSPNEMLNIENMYLGIDKKSSSNKGPNN